MKYLKIGTRHAHRVVAERAIGRPLRRGEVVHHLDGDSTNNAPDNLQVLPSQAEHARLHFTGVKRVPKALCREGHPIDSRTSIGRRACSTCRRAYDNAWKRARRRERGLMSPGPKPESVSLRQRDGSGRFL